MKTKVILAALALAAAGTAMPLAAQPTSSWRSGDAWNRESFWRGAPEGLQQRIDWLQQRIDRGVADGSLSRDEARRAQWQLNTMRRDAVVLQQRLDDLSRSLRWARRNDDHGGGYGGGGYGGGGYGGGGYGGGGGSGRDPYATDYDAAHYYRDDPRYTERRLGPQDEIYRGSDGRYYCKRNDGTTGLVIGMVGGAAIGNVIDGGHDRVAGTLIGGAFGALLGKTIDQNSSDVRCR